MTVLYGILLSLPPPPLRVALGLEIRSRGWPLKQPEIKKMDQNANFEGHHLLRNSPKLKKRGSWMTPKAVRNPTLGVIFTKCVPMTPCPLLVQPLPLIHSHLLNMILKSCTQSLDSTTLVCVTLTVISLSSDLLMDLNVVTCAQDNQNHVRLILDAICFSCSASHTLDRT